MREEGSTGTNRWDGSKASKAAAIRERRRPRLLQEMRQALRCKHYSRRTEQSYCNWVRRFVRFHRMRHPAEMGEAEINAFL